MSDNFYTKTSEATALHAVIDGDLGELNRVLADYSAVELRSLARSAENLAEYCQDAAAER